MKHAALAPLFDLKTSFRVYFPLYFLIFCAGLLGPLGFAPYHMPGFSILSLALLFASLLNSTLRQSLLLGFVFGLGYFGFGVSWVIVSIHDYGQLNYFFAGLLTLTFIAYLSLFPAAVAYLFKKLDRYTTKLTTLLLFSSLWCLSECLRSLLFTGFPWLLSGLSLIDTPLKYLAPIIGLSGLNFLCAFLGALLILGFFESGIKRYFYLSLLVLLLILPSTIKSIHWTQVKTQPISIGAIQANLSMRDKWDETLFWDLLKYYEKSITELLGKQLIILPESAIPLPASYLEEYLEQLQKKTFTANSALLLGILQPTDESETRYYNSLISLGKAQGEHAKQHLVPFGEYIPRPFVAINHWLNLPEPNIKASTLKQDLIQINKQPIASLICYEIAYPNLLRLQLPLAQWIVSISDNGWFGHSLASYQQLQMAQMLSLLSGRFQILVNNDGLSAIINTEGDIVDSLPAFSSGILQGEVFPAEGSTPWVLWNDYPSLIFCLFLLIFIRFFHVKRITQ